MKRKSDRQVDNDFLEQGAGKTIEGPSLRGPIKATTIAYLGLFGENTGNLFSFKINLYKGKN